MVFSENEEINQLLSSVLKRVSEYAEKQHSHIAKLNEIGTALSAESNLSKLLEMILSQAKKFTNADGGTLYLMSRNEKYLEFTVVETNSLNIKMGGTQGKITWPPLHLHKEDGSPNKEMVAALCALEARLVNIPDVYNAEGFNFEGTKKFDANTGYRSKSMLVIPMKNHENEIIGVLQLLNRIDPDSGESVIFTKDDEKATMSLASQAAVAITNAQLVADLTALLESFIKSIAVAIDEKSPYTGGHVRRVAEISLMIAAAINGDDDGKYGGVKFNDETMKEIFFAAWMHDVGKITTPEAVVDKATKLEAIYDRIEVVKTRYEILKRDEQIAYLQARLSEAGVPFQHDELDAKVQKRIETLDEEMEFLSQMNMGGEFLSDDKLERLNKIATRSLVVGGKPTPMLSDDELKNLSIRKGTLTDAERQKINDHATMSLKILESLPFPKKLRRVPEIAGAHHEKLNGKGYPRGLTAEQISLEGRILALADVFEALTAADRPYKKAKTLGEAKKIMGFMVKDQDLDPDLVEFFYQKGLDMEYAKKELKPEQYEEELSQVG